MRKVSIIFIISVAALALFTSGCSLTKKPAPPSQVPVNEVPPFLNQTEDSIKTKTTNNLAIAKSKAIEWKQDAALAGYNIKVPADLTSTDADETFIFSSPQDTYNWWTISINKDGTFIRALIPRQDYLGQGLQPITETAWQKTYLDALNTAEASGGLTFRAQNPEAQVSLLLEQNQPKNYLWWVISYQGANNQFKVRVSARDGGIYDDFGNAILATQGTGQSPQTPPSPSLSVE